jgi:sulfur carrier protein
MIKRPKITFSIIIKSIKGFPEAACVCYQHVLLTDNFNNDILCSDYTIHGGPYNGFPLCDAASCKIGHNIIRQKSLKVISVSINGEVRQFEIPISFTALIEQMQLVGKRIALERNGQIVPRSQFAQQCVADGDRLEIVVAVGGG